MIRAILAVGWLGVLLLLGTAANGYHLVGTATPQFHLMLSLFPSAALLFADLCVLLYLRGTVLLVRRTVAELQLPQSWLAEQRRLAGAAWWWPVLAGLSVAALFASGFAAYAGSWPSWVHHVSFVVAGLLHVVFLLRAGRALRAGESHLAALGAAVEAAGAR